MCITKMACFYLAWTISMLTLLPGKTFASCLKAAKLEDVTGIKINRNETRCYISLHSPDKRQVVAEFFNMVADCTTKSDIMIYDGPEGNEQQIDKFCQKDPISYASRNHSLVIYFKERDKEEKPFSLNGYLINTTKIYRDSGGSIESVRFRGRCEGTKCAPNNLHSIYEVDSPVNVTFHLRFVEFKIRTKTGGRCSGHYLTRTANGRTSEEMCGDGRTPDDVYVKTTNLRLDFYTGSKNAYAGFTAVFSVCRKEVYGNESHGVLKLPLFHRADAAALTCAVIVHVDVKSMVTLNMTFGSKSTYCNNALMVNADGDGNVDSILDDCEKRSMDIEASYNITILFVSSSDQTLTASYSIENIDDEGSATSSNIADEGSTDSHIQGDISGNTTFNSTDKEEFQRKELTKEGGSSFITPIAGAIGGAIFIVVLVIVIVLVHRRKRHRGVDKPSKGKENTNDANIYSDNQDYDVMNIKRSHKTQPDKDVYGTTSTPSDVYAMADRLENNRMMETSDEYDHQYFGNTYAETSTVVQKKAQRNQPNADEYGQHDFENTYTETSTSAQRRGQVDSKDTITDHYEQQDFGGYATTSTSARKNEPKENFYE